jgi:hypothetical protein
MEKNIYPGQILMSLLGVIIMQDNTLELMIRSQGFDFDNRTWLRSTEDVANQIMHMRRNSGLIHVSRNPKVTFQGTPVQGTFSATDLFILFNESRSLYLSTQPDTRLLADPKLAGPAFIINSIAHLKIEALHEKVALSYGSVKSPKFFEIGLEDTSRVYYPSVPVSTQIQPVLEGLLGKLENPTHHNNRWRERWTYSNTVREYSWDLSVGIELSKPTGKIILELRADFGDRERAGNVYAAMKLYNFKSDIINYYAMPAKRLNTITAMINGLDIKEIRTYLSLVCEHAYAGCKAVMAVR